MRRTLPVPLLLVLACGDDSTGAGFCFSPTQHLDRAYLPGAMGCPCDPRTDEARCVRASDGNRVALVCEGETWQAVNDGPCSP